MHMLASLWTGVVSNDEKVRRQLGYWAVTACLYLLCTGLLWLQVSFGDAPRDLTQWLTVVMLGALLPVFLLIRLSTRLGLRPSQLALAQGILAISCTVAFYALSGPARGATLSILLVVLVFCTFTLEAEKSHSLSIFAIALLGLTMFGLVHTDPARFSPRMEMIHFFIAAATLLVVAFLTGKLSELRTRFKAQKAELTDALARIRILATQDELTSLANRRHMSEVLAEEERRLACGGQPTCLALLDIDWFKQINDKHGHDAGDTVLRLFAREAQAALRATDMLARWGGEEFLLLMRNTDFGDAAQVLERVRQRVAMACSAETAHIPPVTFSAGLVTLDAEEGIASGIRRADHALYRAKAAGRNRVMGDRALGAA
ncbi:MAG TPA: diguanylate cyclase [Noviherbaspirillum sp.]|nr:diguanylate cyclase [Noviherbaspirillum sp.]